MSIEWVHLSIEWLRGHEVLLWWMGAASVLMFLGTLAAVPVLVARIPTDYFLRKRQQQDACCEKSSAPRIVGFVTKNVFGLVVILVGVAMLILPGQGVITILLGLFLMSFPGKRRLERLIVTKPPVLRAINWMRARASRPPLEV